MASHELPPPTFEEETFEMFWQRRCAQSEFLREYSGGPPLSRERWREIIDEQYQIALSENYTEEKRSRLLAFLEHLRRVFVDREAYLAEMRQEELEHQAEREAWLADVKSVCHSSR